MARTLTDYEQLLANANVLQGLGLISSVESNGFPDSGYYTMFGGGQFEGDQHPNKLNKAYGLSSTAAGRYQFLSRTWKDLSKKLGLTDFSPRSQDLAALALLDQLGALDDFIAGDFKKAIPKIKTTWTGFGGNLHSRDLNRTPASPLVQTAAPASAPVRPASVPAVSSGLNSEHPQLNPVLNILNLNGDRQTAVAETPGELSLFERFRQYDEEIRGRLLALAPKLDQAENQLRDMPFSAYPTDYDDRLLRLIDQVR
jgi:muramidase (phage lysozyme)